MEEKVKKATEVLKLAANGIEFKEITVFDKANLNLFTIVKNSLESKGFITNFSEDSTHITLYVEKAKHDKYLAELNSRKSKVAV